MKQFYFQENEALGVCDLWEICGGGRRPPCSQEGEVALNCFFFKRFIWRLVYWWKMIYGFCDESITALDNMPLLFARTEQEISSIRCLHACIR